MAGLKQIMEIFMTINQPLSSEQRVRWYLQRESGTPVSPSQTHIDGYRQCKNCTA